MPIGVKVVGGLGNATDADVLEGVIYTSDNGIKRVGSSTVANDLNDHINDKNNPHGLTAAQIGAMSASDISALKKTFTATIGTSWTGTTAPYTQTVAVSGILATDKPVVDIVPSTTFSTAAEQLEAYGNIYRITTENGSITVYATEKTTTNIPIQMEVHRL